MECLTCKSNSGEQRISPGPTIYEGQYWLVEHAYPVKRVGWIVIVLKRQPCGVGDKVREFTAQPPVDGYRDSGVIRPRGLLEFVERWEDRAYISDAWQVKAPNVGRLDRHGRAVPEPLFHTH